RSRHSLRGQLLVVAGAEAEAPRAGRPRGRRASEDAGARAGMDRSSPKARQAKSKARYQRYEDCSPRPARSRPRPRRSSFPSRSVSAPTSSTSRAVEVVRRPAADRRPHLQAAAGRHRRRDRRQRRRQDHAVPHDHRAGEARAGTITVGETVHLGYVDQSRDALDGKKTVWEEISGGNELILLGKKEVNSRGYCSAFNFKGADQQKKVGALSGGERNRVHLAKMLKSGANVLLLDEPTNDLDVDTLRALEEALEDFAGCAVIISHDRWFLDRIAPTSSPSKGTATSSGSRGISRATKRTSDVDSAITPPILIGSSTSPSHGEAGGAGTPRPGSPAAPCRGAGACGSRGLSRPSPGQPRRDRRGPAAEATDECRHERPAIEQDRHHRTADDDPARQGKPGGSDPPEGG
ncbi:hypothetical protein BVRB_018780, partial [Beta vulgaris subsp. vulgaris]